MADEISAPPMTKQDILQIVDIVEARLRVHLPNLERGEFTDGAAIILNNPSNGQKIALFYTFTAAKDGCIGYRVWTLEAIPELLAHLLQSRDTTTGVKQ